MRRLSFSSLTLFSSCPRKWYFQYVRKLDVGTKPGTAFGSAFHSDLERYLKSGDMPRDTRNKALVDRAVGWGLLPEPGTVDLELKFEVPFADTSLIGSVDMVDQCDENLISITDHKTGGDPRWRKTEEELQNDAQLGLYLKALTIVRGHEAEVYQGRHLWYRSKGPIEVHQVGPVTFTHERLEDIWNEKVSVAKMLQVVDSCEDVSMVPGNKQACTAYGGCPYQDVCRLTWDNNTASIGGPNTLEKTIMSLRDKLAQSAANKVTPPVSPVLPTPAQRVEALAAAERLDVAPTPVPVQTAAITNTDRAQVQALGTTAPVTAPEKSKAKRVMLVTGALVLGGSVRYLDDIMAPIMAKIQESKGVPYFAIQYNEGVKILAAGYNPDMLNHGDIVVVRGDISWTGLVVERIRQSGFDLVEVHGIR